MRHVFWLFALFFLCSSYAAASIVKTIDIQTHNNEERILLSATNRANAWYNDDTCDGPTFVTYQGRRALLVHCEFDIPFPLPQNYTLGIDTYFYRISNLTFAN